MTAEPKVEDLLASIKRAIGEETVTFQGAVGESEAPDPTDLGHLPKPLAGQQAAEPEHAFRGSMRELRVQFSDEALAERKPATADDILALRDKITRELKEQDQVTARTGPRAPMAEAGPKFASLLGANNAPNHAEARYSPPPSPPAAPPSRRPPPAIEPNGSLTQQPAHSARYRPPYGQGSFGIRSFAPPPPRIDDGVMSREAGSIAANSFSRFTEQLFAQNSSGERSIDDIARELLRPMLKQWLDQNLPRLVENIVRDEIERVSRRGGR